MITEFNKFAAELDKLAALAKALGMDRSEFDQIVREVNAEAEQSLTWGTVPQRFEKIKNQLINR